MSTGDAEIDRLLSDYERACFGEKAGTYSIHYMDTEASLTAAIAALVKDAQRYRWLRNESLGQWQHPIAVSQSLQAERMVYVGPLCLEALDKAIDEARKA